MFEGMSPHDVAQYIYMGGLTLMVIIAAYRPKVTVQKIVKQIIKLPQSMQNKLEDLLNDLRDNGPIQNEWPN